jgi:hypothetical protein
MCYIQEISWRHATEMSVFKAFQPFLTGGRSTLFERLKFLLIVFAALQKYGIGDTI